MNANASFDAPNPSRTLPQFLPNPHAPPRPSGVMPQPASLVLLLAASSLPGVVGSLVHAPILTAHFDDIALLLQLRCYIFSPGRLFSGVLPSIIGSNSSSEEEKQTYLLLRLPIPIRPRASTQFFLRFRKYFPLAMQVL